MVDSYNPDQCRVSPEKRQNLKNGTHYGGISQGCGPIIDVKIASLIQR